MKLIGVGRFPMSTMSEGFHRRNYHEVDRVGAFSKVNDHSKDNPPIMAAVVDGRDGN